MRGSQVGVVAAAAAVLLLVVVAAGGETAVPSDMVDPSLERGLPGVPLGGQSGSSTGLQFTSVVDPGLVVQIVIGLAVVTCVLALVLSTLSALRGRLRDRTGVGVVVEPAEGTVDTVMRLRLRDAVAQARDLLVREGGEPHDAVIGAWVTLENATEHTRAPHQTATEFTVALLARETADEEALRDLRTLYHRARFGHRSSESDVAAAKDALDRILATIR